MKQAFKTNLVPVKSPLSTWDIRSLAKNEPSEFLHKVYSGVESGKLKFSDIRDIKELYRALADVQVPVTMEMAGAQRSISTSAFPILTGTLAIAAINESYQAVPAIGDALVTDFEDSKKVTSVAAVHSLDKETEEVKELGEFPEVGVDEEKVEIRHKRNGRRLTISAESIEENELPDIISRINALGEIAGEWIEEQTLSRVMDYYGSKSSPGEPYVYRPGGTGTALFSASANTPGTRAPSGTREQNNAFSDESDLEKARVLLASMKNARGKRINVPYSERVLLVPDAIVGSILKVLNSEYVPGVESEVSNWGPRGKWNIPGERVFSSPKLDDFSTSAWYYGAPKRQFRRKWKLRFEYVTLGMDTQAYLSNRIAFQARIAWDCEVGATDYVYWIQNLSGTTAPYDE